MNILKLIKADTKDGKKATVLKQAVISNIVANIDSARGVVRVVHTAAFDRWTPDLERKAVAAFEKAEKETGFRFQFLSKEGRVSVLRVAANEIGRSPEALKIRLKALGKYPTRKGTSKADLKTLVDSAKKKANHRTAVI